MTDSVRKAYSLLSHGYDPKTTNVSAQTKSDIFESLAANNYLTNFSVNRNLLAQTLELQRATNGIGYPFGKIEIRTNPSIESIIDEKKYGKILDQYRDLITNKPENFKQKLHALDTQLAEMLILDHGGAIEFKNSDYFADGKTAEQESMISYRGLNNLETYKDKIEHAVKNEKENTFYVIKWTEAQQKIILDKIGKEFAKKLAPKKPLLMLDAHKPAGLPVVIEEPKKEEPVEEKKPEPKKPETKEDKKEAKKETKKEETNDNEISATISNVKHVHQENANYEAEEKNREEYEKLGKISLKDISTWKPWDRLKTSLLRSARRKKEREKYMASAKKTIDLTRSEVVNASDRHEKEFADAEWKQNIEQKIVNHQNPQVDLLCQEYLTSAMGDRDFETKFNMILRNDPAVIGIIGANNLDFLGSNILLKLKTARAERTMLNQIEKALTDNLVGDQFTQVVSKIANEYFTETQKNYPEYIKKMLSTPDAISEHKNFIANKKALLKIQTKTLKIKLQLLDNTKGAYQIDNQDKEKSKLYKLGAWMDKHPYLTIGGGILATAGILATGGLIGGVAGAITSTAAMTAKLAGITAAKKSSHYTKEQQGQEKRMTHGLNIEKQKMDNIRQVMQNAPRYTWRHYKAKRQFKLYQNATQKHVEDTTMFVSNIKQFIAKPLLTQTEENALRLNIAHALSRVDYYKKSGHNFVASQDRRQVEKDMRDLMDVINEGSEKLGNPLDDIRQDAYYMDRTDALKKDYDNSFANFKKERNNLSVKYGVAAGLLYAGSSLGLQYVLGSGVFGNYPCGGEVITSTPTGNTYTLHDEIKQSLLKSGASTENINNIEQALQKAHSLKPDANGYNQQAWRTIVKNEMKWGDGQIHDWMHNFMKETLWTLDGGNEFKQQLLAAKIDTLTPQSGAVKTAEAFLSSPKIRVIESGEGAKILHNLQDWMNGKSIASFSDADKIKMGNFGHMFIHDDIGVQSKLSQELLQMSGNSVEEICNKHYWFDGLGIPVFANTFMEKMVPTDTEKTKPLKPVEIGEIPTDPSNHLVTTDPNNPTNTPTTAPWML